MSTLSILMDSLTLQVWEAANVIFHIMKERRVKNMPLKCILAIFSHFRPTFFLCRGGGSDQARSQAAPIPTPTATTQYPCYHQHPSLLPPTTAVRLFELKIGILTGVAFRAQLEGFSLSIELFLVSLFYIIFSA